MNLSNLPHSTVELPFDIFLGPCNGITFFNSTVNDIGRGGGSGIAPQSVCPIDETLLAPVCLVSVAFDRRPLAGDLWC